MCVEYSFDLEKIDEYLRCYEVDKKYEDVAAFQWQMTVTRQEKNLQRRLRLMEAERKRGYKER